MTKKMSKKTPEFWNFIRNKATDNAPESVELRIEGDIVDDNDIWLYEWFGESATAPNPFKEALNAHKNEDITVWIDSFGGSVFAGASIYNALKSHTGKVTVKVEKAMSAASVIAMAGDEILMSPTSLMMIHNPLTGAYGDMHDMRKVADILDEVKETIVNAYVGKTGRDRASIADMMDRETWMSANKAVEEGFATGVLFQDNGLPIADVQNFSFNTLQIVNAASASVKRMVDKITDDATEEKEKLLLEIELI